MLNIPGWGLIHRVSPALVRLKIHLKLGELLPVSPLQQDFNAMDGVFPSREPPAFQ
jgi:hypothetical protein